MLTTIQPHFANRSMEIKGVKNIIAQIRTHSNSHYCIVNFYGVAGVGKSTLLTRLRDEMRSERIPCALIDFAGRKYGDLEVSKTVVLEDIVTQLNVGYTFVSSSGFESVVRRYWDGRRQVDPDQSSNLEGLMHQVISEFINYVHSLLIASPAVLLFDTTEDGEKILSWLQKNIIGDLIAWTGLLVIAAGRQPMKIDDGRLLPRMAKPFRLSPFTLASIQDQIPQYADFAQLILPITFGHPLANLIIANKLEQMEREIAKPLNKEVINSNLHMLSHYLCESLIEQKLVPKVNDDLLVAFRIVALVRRFDLNSLQKLLEKQPDLPQNLINASFCLLLLQKMQKTGIVEWDSIRKGFALDETIRRQFAFEMFLNNREKFTTLNQIAIEIYNRCIKEYPSNKIIYLLELLFHSGKSLEAQGGDATKIIQSLSSIVIEGLNYICGIEGGIDLIPALELFEELQRDTDLHQLCGSRFDELISLVSSFVERNK
jgi:hypothetical protein